MEIQGRIIAVLPAKQGVSQKDGKAWKSQEFVIETMEQFPKRCMFNVFSEEKLNQFNIQLNGEYIVKFDINAREYNGRWYNDLRAWSVTPAQAQQAQQAPQADTFRQTGADAIPAPTIASPNDSFGDVPF